MTKFSENYVVKESDNKYEENIDFNEYLNQQGEIEIEGLTFQRSWILFNLDPVAYHSGLKEFQQNKEEEFKEMVCSDFPTSIAYPFYRSVHGYVHNTQRLLLLRDTWESIVYTLYAIVIGEFCFLNIPLKAANINEALIFSDKLAEKLLTIERLLEFALKKNYGLNSNDIIPINVIAKIRELNRLRNEFSHSPAPSEEQANKIYSESSLEVFSVLQDLENLKDIQLIRPIGQEGNLYNLRCEVYRGLLMAPTIETIKIDQEQLTRSCKYFNEKYLLCVNNKSIYRVSPFLHYKKDETGHLTSICAWKKQKGKKLVFGILGIGGEFELNSDEFQSEITEVESLLSLEERAT